MKISLGTTAPLFQTYRCEIILGLCALFLVYAIARALKKAGTNFPPGPAGLPLVGYLPFLSKDVHLDFMHLGRKYGDVFSLKLGSQDIVILHGADAVIEAFNKPEFLGRPPLFEKINPSSAFMGSNVPLWKEQRSFVVHSMKALGFGRTKIEDDIIEEINHFTDFLRKSEARPLDIRKQLCASMSNNICSLIFGKRFEYNHPDRQFLNKTTEEFAKFFSQISLDMLFPWIRSIPFAVKFLRSQQSRSAVQNYENYFRREMNEHLKTFNPFYVRDFIDGYLIEIDKHGTKYPDTSFNQNMLIKNALGLFFAGSETVGGTFLWIIYSLAAFPHVRQKVEKEIMEVIGPDKTPECRDMRNMPYTRALIMEVMRWKTPSPVSLMHCALADTTLGGYILQKGTNVIANLHAVHHDPRYWDEPEKFKPERFLSKDGKSVVKPRYFMPFIVGRRACLGESMAYLELFLYLTSILREFDVVFPDETEPSFEGRLIFTYRPKPFVVRFIPKN